MNRSKVELEMLKYDNLLKTDIFFNRLFAEVKYRNAEEEYLVYFIAKICRLLQEQQVELIKYNTLYGPLDTNIETKENNYEKDNK